MKRILSIILIIATMCVISACNQQSPLTPESSTPVMQPPETEARREAQYTGRFVISQNKVEFAPNATIKELFDLDNNPTTFPEEVTSGTIEISIWNYARHSSITTTVTSLNDAVPAVVWFNNKQGDFDAMVFQLLRSTTAVTMEVTLRWGNTVDRIRLSFDSPNNDNCKYNGDWQIIDTRVTTII